MMENGENMPNSPFVHLSSSITWRDIYLEMVQTLTAQGKDVCSENYFHRIRKREFSHVKIPKVSVIYFVCKRCKCKICIHVFKRLNLYQLIAVCMSISVSLGKPNG